MLNQKQLKEQLHYDQKTRIFTRLKSISQVKAGDIAGCLVPTGYLQINVCGKLLLAHRLAFLYMEGYFPEYSVDHMNGVKTDNKWKNLRHATQSCNLQNKKISSANKSGFTGVTFLKRENKWQSRIVIARKTIHLGTYTDKLEAALARLTFESNCPLWKCDHKSRLNMAIKQAWPDFNHKFK